MNKHVKWVIQVRQVRGLKWLNKKDEWDKYEW